MGTRGDQETERHGGRRRSRLGSGTSDIPFAGLKPRGGIGLSLEELEQLS